MAHYGSRWGRLALVCITERHSACVHTRRHESVFTSSCALQFQLHRASGRVAGAAMCFVLPPLENSVYGGGGVVNNTPLVLRAATKLDNAVKTGDPERCVQQRRTTRARGEMTTGRASES